MEREEGANGGQQNRHTHTLCYLILATLKHHRPSLTVAKCLWSWSEVNASWCCGTDQDHLRELEFVELVNTLVI